MIEKLLRGFGKGFIYFLNVIFRRNGFLFVVYGISNWNFYFGILKNVVFFSIFFLGKGWEFEFLVIFIELIYFN